MSEPVAAEKLCLACGLCCNGVIFADVQLQDGDDATQLRTLGLRLKGSALRNPRSEFKKFSQPCAAHDGCRCHIYSARPKYCREFECALLKKVFSRHVQPDAALRVIQSAKQRAERVRKLLRQLGDVDESRPLSQRFRRTRKRIEAGVIDEETSDLFGQLTLAVHDLNVCLSQNFYPGE